MYEIAGSELAALAVILVQYSQKAEKNRLKRSLKVSMWLAAVLIVQPVMMKICTGESLADGLVLMIFTLIGVCDTVEKRIPNELNLMLTVLGLAGLTDVAASGKWGTAGVREKLIGGIMFLAAFYVVGKLSRGGLGFGDVKMLGAAGLLEGLSNGLGHLTLAVFLVASVSLPLVAVKKLKKQKITGITLPFGPFFAISFVMMFMV